MSDKRRRARTNRARRKAKAKARRVLTVTAPEWHIYHPSIYELMRERWMKSP